MIITVLSGKGGTGKTTVATNMALSLDNVQLLDADVEEPNSYLFLKPDFRGEYEPVYRLIPVIDEDKCIGCRECVDFCEYNALAFILDKVLVFSEVCHSCGGCFRLCPAEAITEEKQEIGNIKWDHLEREPDFWQGELNIGEETSVPVIKQLKSHIDRNRTVIIDAQPGTTCPTIEAAVESDYCILVTEPSPFGLNDLQMAVEVIRDLNIPFGVIINRSEDEYDVIIEDYCKKEAILILLKIPYLQQIARLYSVGTPFVKILPEWKEKFFQVIKRIEGGNRMKKITVVSGKGGTGKTTVIANLAALANNIVLADCDVDAPNMHLLLKPTILDERIFSGGKLAVKNTEKCTDCGICREVCRFGAVTPKLDINSIKCDGCGVCVAVCPEKALKLEQQMTGHIYIADTLYGPMVYARLKAGAENSGKLVSEVQAITDKIAVEEKKELIMIDSSPGIGCPVIASLKGTDFALIITEPTMSGFSDLKRVLMVVGLFNINSLVVINKYDLNEDLAEVIEKFCRNNNIPVVGRISFSPIVNKILRDGGLLVQQAENSKPALEIMEVWHEIKKLLNGGCCY